MPESCDPPDSIQLKEQGYVGARGQKVGSLNTIFPTNLSQTPGPSLHMFLSKGRGGKKHKQQSLLRKTHALF